MKQVYLIAFALSIAFSLNYLGMPAVSLGIGGANSGQLGASPNAFAASVIPGYNLILGTKSTLHIYT